MARWNNPNCGFQKGHKDFLNKQTREKVNDDLRKIAKANVGHPCHYKAFGENNKNWKGGRVKLVTGYIRLSLNGFTITEHRYVMEQYLGRKLLRSEIVHHINGDKTDNRIENLQLMNSQSDHATYHLKKRFNLL